MEFAYEVYNWLKSEKVIQTTTQETEGKIKLSEQDSSRLELGFILPLLSNASKLPKISDLKKVNNSSSRYYN